MTSSKKGGSSMIKVKLNQNKEGFLELTENIRVVILENLIHQRKLKYLK
jgi:hypothetical protein